MDSLEANHSDAPENFSKFLGAVEATEHFGEHVMIDGYHCSDLMLNDRGVVFKCLDELPQLLHMKQLSKPEVYYATGNSPKDPGGWTGVVVVEESHISIHTFPRLHFVTIDVYTCKNGLIVSSIENYFRKELGVGFFETNFVRRGLNFTRLALSYMSHPETCIGGVENAPA